MRRGFDSCIVLRFNEELNLTEQRSEEWFAARRGKVTASRIADLLATIRSGAWAASRKNYAAELVTERLTGKSPEPYNNEAIQWGVDQEEPARQAYTKVSGSDVEETGFVDHPTVKDAGASPDGLVGEEGLIEIKCPTTATHIDTLLGADVNEKYRLQMMWQMACTGRKWCDFVSYDPRLPEQMQVFIKRFERDDEEIREIEGHVRVFLEEVEETTRKLKSKYGE
jgi:putative phage-type endonuclease